MDSVKLPYSIQKLKGAVHTRIVNDFLGHPNGLVQIGPEKWILPSSYADYADVIYNFEARPDDVFITTFPRSGTTWTQEMIWLICNDLDYETASTVRNIERFPYLEFRLIRGTETVYESLINQTTRRFIKTHLPLNLMPRNIKEVGAKIVYVARNPKDVAASCYNFYKVNPMLQFSGDFESFAQYFMDDFISYGPYWKHVLGGWNHRNDENVHFMFYEESMFDLANSLRKLSIFLGKPLREADLPKLMDYLQFDNIKKNQAVNFKFNPNDSSKDEYVRRGKVGGNPEITKEMSKKFDEWTKKNLIGSDLKIPFI